jgi:hypothetical protein
MHVNTLNYISSLSQNGGHYNYHYHYFKHG